MMRAVKKRGRGGGVDDDESGGGGDFGDRVKNKRTQYVYVLSIDVEPV